ncbi:MAG: hypothetical protein AAGH46_09730 [Bacteroidota bacterium]
MGKLGTLSVGYLALFYIGKILIRGWWAAESGLNAIFRRVGSWHLTEYLGLAELETALNLTGAEQMRKMG